MEDTEEANRETKLKKTAVEIPAMTDAGLSIDSMFEYHDVDRQSVLSVIMEVIANGLYCLGLRDIIKKKKTTLQIEVLDMQSKCRNTEDY